MFKVLFKDQYTSGYAKKIAGSYTLVAGFLIRQYSFQYTCCILKELWGILMLCRRHVYGTLTVVAGFLIPHYTSPYIWCILHEAGRVLICSVESTCTDSFTRERITFMSLQRSVDFTYTVGSITYRYHCCFKVGIRILIRFMTRFQAIYQCTHEYCKKTVVYVLWGL